MKRLIAAAVVASALITVPVVLATGSPDGNSLWIHSSAKANLTMAHTAKFVVSDDLYFLASAPVYLSNHSALTTGWKCNIRKSPATCVSSGGHFVPIRIPGAGGTTSPVTVTCSVSTQAISLSAPLYTDGPNALPSGPTFSKCKDNITVKPDYATFPATGEPPGCTSTGCNEAIASHGAWTSTYNDASDAAGETQGASGDTIGIQGPNDALTNVSSGSPMCVIDVNPSSVAPGPPSYTATIGHDGPAVGDYNDATGVDSLPSGGNPTHAVVSFQVNQNPALPSLPCPLAGGGSTPPDMGHALFSGSYTIAPLLGDS
jgi:hypothetical protein